MTLHSDLSAEQLDLWTPLDEHAEYDAAEEIGLGLEFRHWLKLVDDRLDLIFVKPEAKSFPYPGRFYIVRINPPGTPNGYYVVQDEQGDYCVPDDRHLERFREFDSHAHPDVWRKFQAANRDRARQLNDAQKAKVAEFSEKLLERVNFEFRGHIWIPEDAAGQLGHKDAKRPPPPPRRKRRDRGRQHRKGRR